MTNEKQNEVGYQFTAVPTNLMMCCDNNIRSMLFTMIQLSTYYANDDGWFFRTNADLQAETNLSENLVRATLSELHSQGILDIRTVGAAKGTIPNYFKVNIEKFEKWENLSIEDAMKNPLHKIVTPNYKAKGWKPSYLNAETMVITEHPQPEKSNKKIKESEIPIGTDIDFDDVEWDGRNTKPQVVATPFSNVGKSEDNINNRTNEDNENNKQKELKAEIDRLCELMHTERCWDKFRDYRQKLRDFVEQSDQRERSYVEKRIGGIETHKFKYFAKVAANSPYDEQWDEVYKKTGCGYKQVISEPKPVIEISKEDRRRIEEFRQRPWSIYQGPKPSTDEEILEYFKQTDENIRRLQEFGQKNQSTEVFDSEDDELPF